MKKTINVLFVLIWMIIIFIMSSFDSSESSNQSNFIVNIISNIFNIDNINALSLIIRKLAHFSEYFILGILVYNSTQNYKKYIWLPIIICISYAISDEIHQIFVPGREGRVLDITIDSIGATIGIYSLQVYKKLLKHI